MEPQVSIDSPEEQGVVYLLGVNKESIIRVKLNLEDRMKSLTVCQRKVLDFVEKHCSEQLLLFISGGGGVGKSFLLQTLVLFFESGANIVEVLATSGNAAKLVNGETIHSFFKVCLI